MAKSWQSMVCMVLLVLAMPSLWASGKDSELVNMRTWMNELSSLASELNTIEAHVTRLPTRIGNKPVVGDQGQIGKLTWMVDGVQYYVDDQLVKSIDGDSVRQIIAFDGNARHYFNSTERTLSIQSVSSDEASGTYMYLYERLPLLMVFDWLTKPENDRVHVLTSLARMKKELASDDVISRVIKTEWIKWADQPATKISIRGGVDLQSGTETIYVLFVSAANPIPLGWQRYTNDWELVRDLWVSETSQIETAKGSFFVYPSRIRTGFYGGNSKWPFQKWPVTSMEWTFNVKTINKSLEESIFQLDPSIADRIFDVTNKIVIPMPK